jgi:hypothetical protein
MATGSVAHEVDETALDLGVDQLNVDVIAYDQPLEPALWFPFCRSLKEPDPRGFVGCTRDAAVELLA